jgi:DNA polymerase (family 10)
LSEHGIKRGGKLYKYANEEDFYKALGLRYIPPELREDSGEIEASIKGKLPGLVELKDIKGDLHMHTNIEIETSHDMGVSSVRELLNMAEGLGYEYIGLSDHNPKMKGLSEAARIEVVRKRNEAIDKEIASSESSVKIFKGMEVDIRPDGQLAVGDEVLKLLDYAVISIHASFRQNKDEATVRVLRAINHPRVKIFGHPTGRMLNKREGLDYDWERVFEECKRRKIAVEINSSPERLDLPDMLVRQAVKMGVLLVINTDAHEVSSLNGMKYGVGVARRGWAETKTIVNTWPYQRMEKWIKS